MRNEIIKRRGRKSWGITTLSTLIGLQFMTSPLHFLYDGEISGNLLRPETNSEELIIKWLAALRLV